LPTPTLTFFWCKISPKCEKKIQATTRTKAFLGKFLKICQKNQDFWIGFTKFTMLTLAVAKQGQD
jgi:hypothetical protein